MSHFSYLISSSRSSFLLRFFSQSFIYQSLKSSPFFILVGAVFFFSPTILQAKYTNSPITIMGDNIVSYGNIITQLLSSLSVANILIISETAKGKSLKVISFKHLVNCNA